MVKESQTKKRDTFIKNAKKILSNRNKAKNELIETINNIVDTKKSLSTLLTELKGFVNGKGNVQMKKIHAALKGINLPDGSDIKKLFTVLNETNKTISILLTQKEAEISEMEKLKVSVNEFVNSTIQDIQYIKIHAADKNKNDSTQPEQTPSMNKDVLSVSLFKLNNLDQSTDPSKLFKKKRKRD